MQAFNKCTKTSYYNRLVNSQIESNNLKDTLKKTLINIVQKRIQSQGFTSEKDFGDEDYRKVLKYLLQSNALGNVLLDAGIKEVSKYRLSSTLAKDKIFALKKYVEITTDITLEISTIAPAPISQLFNINLRPNNALREDKKNLNFFMQQTAMERRNPDHFQLKPAESILSDFQLLKNLLTKKAYSQKATAQILECHQKKLAQLNLNACELNEFPASEILAYLPQLKSINLSNNFIKNLPTELFNQLPELQKLNLAHNQIEIIPEFMAPNQLVHLNLSNNHIQEIPTYSLDQLANLQTLNLADNYLSKISSNNFTRLNNLQSLYLSANQISEISENAFINLQNLHTLTLDNNQIQNIKTNNFNGLKNLLQLDLSYNKIEIIPPLAFNELNNLQVLNLRNGKLKELSAKAFFGLNSLKELELKYNSIESIDNTAFKALPTLKMLNLANNNIEQLPELPDVQKINFTKNKIKLLQNGAFANCLSLQQIKCDNNLLNPNSDLTRILHPILAKIIATPQLHFHIYLSKSFDGFTLHQNTNSLIDLYLRSPDQQIKLICEEYCLALLLKNILYIPEASKCLANRIYNNKIKFNQIYPKQSLEWLCKFLSQNNLSVLPYLVTNKAFLQPLEYKQFETALQTYQLMIPINNHKINLKVRNKLQNLLFSIFKNETLASKILVLFTQENGIAYQANQYIKNKITHLLRTNELVYNEEQINTLLEQINSTSSHRNGLIKNTLTQIIPFNHPNFETLKISLYEECIIFDKHIIQINIMNGICNNHSLSINSEEIEHLAKYYDWAQIIEDYKERQFIKLAMQTMTCINEFKENPQIYQSLIINYLAYLTPNDISAIKSNVEDSKQLDKLNLINNYYDMFSFSTDTPAKIYFIQKNDYNLVLKLKELNYLSPLSNEMALEQITLTKLTYNDGEIIHYQDNHLNQHNFKEIADELPIWLVQNISKHFTVANSIARITNQYFIQMLQDGNIQADETALNLLTKAFYTSSRNLNSEINISITDKKELLRIMQDQPRIEDLDKPLTGIKYFSQFYQEIISQIPNRFKTEYVEDLLLKTLPFELISRTSQYTKYTQQINDNLLSELKPQQTLKHIQSNEIYYALAIYFMHLSSSSGLGYHKGEINNSVHRLRLLGAICLSQCLLNSDASNSEIRGLYLELKKTLLTSECAGQIAQRLYGPYSKFTSLNRKITMLLNTIIAN